NTPYPAILDTALYARMGRLNRLIQTGTMLVYIVSYLTLTLLALAPLRRVRIPVSLAGWRRIPAWLASLRRALQSDARWRAYLLLWVWLTVPPLTMLRHGKTVQPHYLFILYPALFLSVGVAVDAMIRETPRLLSLLLPLLQSRFRIHPRQAQRAVTWSAVAVVLLVALGQGTQAVLFIAALGGNQVNTVNFGYPLNQLLAADSALSAMQRSQHAGAVVVSMPSRYIASAMNSTLIREHSDRTGVVGDCLVLPAPSADPALVVSTRAASPQARLLAALPNANRVRDYAMPGDEPLVIYRLNRQAPLPLLSDERALSAVTWQDGHGNALRLVAGTRTAAGVIRLRWVVQHAAESATETPQFEIQALAPTMNAARGPMARASCQPTTLHAGEAIFTWVTTAWSATGTSLTAVAPPLPGTPLTLAVLHGTLSLWQGTVGPLRVLAAAPGGDPLVPMTPSDAKYQLPNALTMHAAP
ncbi:MAG TPA: hypothetical protein VF040_06315, partial [Ktedonobacterales bacterium]